MQSLCVGISTLLLTVLLPWPGAGEFRVVGPGALVIASVGKETVIPCHLNPETNAEDMDVTWERTDISAQVHHYAKHKDHLEDQSLDYQGRTEFLKENINKGQVALRIFPILLSDGGFYRCVFANSTFDDEAQFEVIVTDSGTVPQIHIEPGGTGKMKLTCTSMGWYPEPQVQWMNLHGRPLTPSSETITEDIHGLFHVQTSVTVNTEFRDVSCVISNSVVNEEKEAQLSLSEALFPRLWPWIVGFTVPLCLLVAGTAFCVLYIRGREKIASLTGQLASLTGQLGSLTGQLALLTGQLARRKALGEDGLENLRRFAEYITLDKNTAHPNILVDGKHVHPVSQKQVVPDNPERFDTLMAVLGEDSFLAGDHYWEVVVRQKKQKDRWTIGLCIDSVKRKGDISVCPENGFWTLSLDNDEYKALSTPHSILSVPESLSILGIFLQYEKGLISFYNVTDCSFLYAFKSTFTSALKPYFDPGPPTEGNFWSLFLRKCQ